MLLVKPHYRHDITWKCAFWSIYMRYMFTVVDTWATVWWCAFAKSCAADRWSSHAVRSRGRMVLGIRGNRGVFLQSKHIFYVDLSRNSLHIVAQTHHRWCLETHMVTAIWVGDREFRSFLALRSKACITGMRIDLYRRCGFEMGGIFKVCFRARHVCIAHENIYIAHKTQ